MSSQSQDLYAILGVSPDALEDDVRRAYRAVARRLHPDVNTHPGAANQFRDITAAYETLTDSVARHNYDAKRRQNGPGRSYFTMQVTPSKRVLPVLREHQVLYLLLDLAPDRSIQSSQTSTPLNLTLVIDRSTSMNGIRLERTKAAAHHIIDQLSSQDVFSAVMFSDRAETLVNAAPMTEKPAAKAMLMTMQASGGTEILQGLQAGFDQNKRYASSNFVNHIVLITDGRTYGDEVACLQLAEQCTKQGIGISAMGIGEEWNDAFLDRLASTTGGTSQYINTPGAVVRFLNDRVRSLGQSLAERVAISLAPDPDVTIESAFRLTPDPQPILHNQDPVQVGQLQIHSNTSLLLQLQMPPLPQPGYRSLMRIEVSGDILWDQRINYRTVADTSVEVAGSPAPEEPPIAIIDALGKLTLYRMQQKAEESVSRGEVREATRRLENLATRLLAAGHTELANAAMSEARRVSKTSALSEEGQKTLKYGTRMLLIPAPKDAPK